MKQPVGGRSDEMLRMDGRTRPRTRANRFGDGRTVAACARAGRPAVIPLTRPPTLPNQDYVEEHEQKDQ